MGSAGKCPHFSVPGGASSDTDLADPILVFIKSIFEFRLEYWTR
jgi:hypothetical protein